MPMDRINSGDMLTRGHTCWTCLWRLQHNTLLKAAGVHACIPEAHACPRTRTDTCRMPNAHRISTNWFCPIRTSLIRCVVAMAFARRPLSVRASERERMRMRKWWHAGDWCRRRHPAWCQAETYVRQSARNENRLSPIKRHNLSA